MSAHKWQFIHLITIASLFAITSNIFAQTQGPSADDIVARMKQELKLSDEQVNQIKPIIGNEIKQRQQIKEQAKDQGIDRQALRQQMQALRQDTESKLSQYLSQDQLAQWKDKQQLKDKLNNDENSTGRKGFESGRSGHHKRSSFNNDF